MKRFILKMLALLMAVLVWIPNPSAFAQSDGRYTMQKLNIDIRVSAAFQNLEGTLRGKVTVYQREGVEKINDFMFYTVDEQKKPIAQITDIKSDSQHDCSFQGEEYFCMTYTFAAASYSDNVFGAAVYAASDKNLRNQLAAAPIWEGGIYAQYFAQNGSFTDESPYKNEVEGTLTWQPAADESKLAGYEVYMMFETTPSSFEYVGTVRKGASSYSLNIPETVFSDHGKLTGFLIYAKSPFGHLSENYAFVNRGDNESAGEKADPSAKAYADPDREIPVPETVKPIPAPKVPTGKPPIRVFIHGEEVEFQSAPYLSNNTTLVQFRPIFEKLGLSLEWDANNRKITGNKAGLELELTINKQEAVVNGKKSPLVAAPKIKNDYTFVPLRFIGEATGLNVIWDANLPAVYIVEGSTEGKLYYPDGTLMYEGQLKDGVMHGKGKLYREDGTLWYNAEFVDGDVTGLGTIYFTRSARSDMPGVDFMIGESLNGLPHGHSRYYYGDGSLAYDGEFSNGERTYGRHYENGVLVYEGQWKNKMYDGKGKYYKDGYLSYEGEFSKNAEHGYGKTYSKKGYVSAEGEYRNGVLEVHAKLYYPNGQIKYEGEFREGYRWGEGKEYYPNGKVEFEGTYWGHNRETGTYYYPNGNYYVGEFVNNSPHGQGKLFGPDGKLIYEGNYPGDIPNTDGNRIKGRLE